MVREDTDLFGAVSPHDGVLDTLILPQVPAEAMSLFLAEVAQRRPRDYLLLALDGAGWHRAHDLVVPDHMRLVFLLPDSSELNPAEPVWDEIREKRFPHLVFHSLEGVADRLAEAALYLESHPDRVASITAFDWIVNIPLSAT